MFCCRSFLKSNSTALPSVNVPVSLHSNPDRALHPAHITLGPIWSRLETQEKNILQGLFASLRFRESSFIHMARKVFFDWFYCTILIIIFFIIYLSRCACEEEDGISQDWVLGMGMSVIQSPDFFLIS